MRGKVYSATTFRLASAGPPLPRDRHEDSTKEMRVTPDPAMTRTPASALFRAYTLVLAHSRAALDVTRHRATACFTCPCPTPGSQLPLACPRSATPPSAGDSCAFRDRPLQHAHAFCQQERDHG
eukprot:1264106-Rhodomonas_salina.1